MLSPDPAILRKRGRFLPISDLWKEMIPADQVSGFLASHKEPWEVSSSSTQCQILGWHILLPLSLELQVCFVSWSSALICPAPPLPACVWIGGGGRNAVLPSPFAACHACLLSFKEFKGWLPRSVRYASICFLYSVLVGSSHWLYI